VEVAARAFVQPLATLYLAAQGAAAAVL